MIYFDNAATTFPKPKCVGDAVREAMEKYGANPGRSGHTMSVETAMQIYECRQKTAELFGSSHPEQVVFTQNCTHALNIVLKGYLKRGNHILISDMEHNSVNSVVRPLYTMHNRYGVYFSSFPVYEDDTERTCYECRKRIRRNTVMIECTHASNVFGIKAPVRELSELAHKYGIKFMVDAAQTAGLDEILFDAWGLDFLCASGHKGLYAPTGTGILIAKNGSVLRTLTEGGSGMASLDTKHPVDMPEHLESGTLNTVGIIGMKAGVEYLLNSDRNRLLENEMKLIHRAYSRMKNMEHIVLYTKYPDIKTHAPVISFNIKGYNSETVTNYLNKKGFALRGGYHCAPSAHRKFNTLKTGTCRMSVGIFNTMEEIEKFCDVLENIYQNIDELTD